MEHAPAPTRRLPVEIPLPSKPRDYRPGDGPPLAPISLSLPDDTGAFIIEKRVLPGKPVNGELKLELYYVVGWPDLPAARVDILATKILDYVSPWRLEDWEYRYSLEKDAEREREEATAKRKRDKDAKAQITSTPVTGTSTPVTPGQKKRGRPSKAEVQARHIAQQASFGEDELANVPLPPASTSGPSLSTPKKRLAQVRKDMEDLEETDTNKAISKQLQGGSESTSDFQPEMGEEEALDELNKPSAHGSFASLNSFLPAPSSRGYAEFLVPNLPSFSTQHDPSRSIPPAPIFLPPNSKTKSSSKRKTQLTTHVPVPSHRDRIWNMSETPVPAPSYPLPKPKLPTLPHVATLTPIPVPQHPVPKSRPKQWTAPPEPKVTPVRPPLCPVPRPKQPHKVTYTHVPPPQQILPDRTMGLPEQNSFVPAGYSSRKQPASADNKSEQRDQPHTPSTIATPVAKPGSSRKRKQSQVEDEQEWEVKRLEGDKVMETDGKLVRYFRVRWAGKWPPGQNPTWEPEENISEAIVRKYLKTKAAKTAQSGSSPVVIENLTPTVKRTYSSVAEAFAGDDDTLLFPSSGGLQTEESDDDNDGVERLQVTEQTRANTPSRRPRIDPELVRELAASFL
ncbi:hypothetical protein GGR51DRAFT_525149 [Nemania sp. FL0031]|nr:hypothetical protein GGR51DRAFT_525149 [Nemania sp. FL0031]